MGGGGESCKVAAHKKDWVVVHRMCNYSAFSGYKWTPSDYSLVSCPKCRRSWRTKASYVNDLPNGELH